jgi:hypothetical protein
MLAMNKRSSLFAGSIGDEEKKLTTLDRVIKPFFSLTMRQNMLERLFQASIINLSCYLQVRPEAYPRWSKAMAFNKLLGCPEIACHKQTL